MAVASSEVKPHSHSKYLAVITLLALLVVALSSAAGYYYMNRTTIQAAKTSPPTLTTKLHSQQMMLTPWNDSVTFTSSTTYSCSNGQTIPGTIVIEALNFTENLSGRDPGSTWISFRTLSTPALLINGANLTQSLIRDLLCGTLSVQERAASLLSSGETLWRVLSSGSYVLLSDYVAYTTPPTTSLGGGVANESWTVSTISTD